MRFSLIAGMVLLVVSSIPALAQSLAFDQLVEADRVRMTVQLLPENDVLVSQKVTLQIELSTDRWFVGGTKIDDLEIRNIIVPKRSEFAVNSTRKERGVTWTVQRWDIDLYPRVEGNFTIPSLEVQVTVSGDDNQAVSGSFHTHELAFAAFTPAELAQQTDWIASDKVTLRESWDSDFDEIETGHAITRTLTMEAEGVPAMMLKGFTPESIDGIATYPKSPDIQDKTSRGESKGIRKDVITYFFEKPGTYTLPEQHFVWWNLSKAQVETLVVKEKIFIVTASTTQSEQTIAQPTTRSNNPFPFRSILVTLITAAFVLWIVYKVTKGPRLKKLIQHYSNWQNRPPTEKDYWKQCLKAANTNEAKEILKALYIWLDRGLNEPQIKTLEEFAECYGNSELASSLQELSKLANQSIAANPSHVTSLLKNLSTARSRWQKKNNTQKTVVMQLNP